MSTEDKLYKDFAASVAESEITPPPAWELFSGKVKQQNFATAGLKHWNYLTIGVLAILFAGGVAAYVMSESSDGTANTIIQSDAMIDKPQNQPEGENSSIPATVEDDNTEPGEEIVDEPLTEKPEPVQIQRKEPISHELEHRQPVSNQPADGRASDKEDRHEPVVVETVKEGDVVESDAPVTVEAENVMNEVKAGKKLIVFDTDTVVEYDTLNVTKKKRRRK